MADAKYLEKLYLPSRWSKRLSPEIIVEKHVEFANRESKRARATIPSTLNITYGSREKEKIDIFGTDLEKDAPVFVFVHGGYWQEQTLKRDTYHFITSNLYKKGIKSIYVGYELCPNVSLVEIIEEIESATLKCIDYAKKNNSKGLYLCGYSAGAHLVATLFTNFIQNLIREDNQKIIKAAILIAGIYDLAEIPKTSINLLLKLDQKEAVKLSPLKLNIPRNVTRFYVITAEDDSPEFIKQSKEFHEKLEHLRLKSTLLIVDNVDHFDVVERLVDEDFQLTKLFINIVQES